MKTHTILLAALALAGAITAAEARPVKQNSHSDNQRAAFVNRLDVAAIPAYPMAEQTTRQRGRLVAGGSQYVRVTADSPRAQRAHPDRAERESIAVPAVVMLPHPAGCPAVKFCACGAAVDIFGEARRDLWPVSVWYGFERTAPAPGMVVLQHAHHLFVLAYQISGTLWMTRDYNSGGHQSRRHAQDIAGMQVVNPHSQLATRQVHRHRTAKHQRRAIRLAARR